MIDVDKDYIERALSELIDSFGLREPVDHYDIVYLINEGNIDEAVIKIARELDLPIKVNISYISSNYNKNAKSGFEGQHVVEVKPQGSDSGGITAQVGIPPDLPFYGSERLKGFPIDIRLSEDSAKYPKTFISVMAHELTHVVLYSMHHLKKDNEIYTDLAAMIFGFHRVMKYGRKTKEITNISFEKKGGRDVKRTNSKVTTYGYLNDKNFNFAFQKIKNELKEFQKIKDEQLSKAEKIQEEIIEIRLLIDLFHDYRNHLNNSMPDNISGQHAKRISQYNSVDYKSRDLKAVKDFSNLLMEYIEFLNNSKKYNKTRKKKALKLEDEIHSQYQKITDIKENVQEEINVMKKYSSWKYWIKKQSSRLLRFFSR